MSDKYVLRDGVPVIENDLMAWGLFMQKAERHIGEDRIGDVRISTIFLGLDHRWKEDESPILWETMIFGGPHDQYQERYATIEDAKAGHARAVALASETCDTPHKET